MILLPIVERELRVAARKRSTFWVRIIGALAAITIGTGFLLLTKIGSLPFSVTQLGSGLFATITWLSFAAALVAGMFLTSDCLSEEKREGTLGFLFLTDLRGHDVVSGKLLATSLQGFYGLIAVLPIVAMTMVLGGVTGTQLWKVSLALVNALFISLSAGLFVSAISRDSQKAMAGTLLLLLALAGGGPTGDALLALLSDNSLSPILSLTSPVYLFISTSAWSSTPFWPILLVNQLVGWSLFAATCVVIPRAWQEKSRTGSHASTNRAHRWKFGGAERRARVRRQLVDVNPVLWLTCRERWQTIALWAFAIGLLGGAVALLVRGATDLWMIWNYLGGFFTLLLYLGVASQASRFLVDARRSGLLELLLATPLSAPQIIRGQWQGLWRMLGLPLCLCLVVQFYASYVGQREMWSGLRSAVPPPTPAATGTNAATTNSTNTGTVGSVTVSVGGTAVATSPGIIQPHELVTLATSVGGMLAVLGNLIALVWFGMWMGMTSRTSNLATLKTILFVQVIPWFGITFASAMIMPLLMYLSFTSGSFTKAPMQSLVWYPLLMSGTATLLSLIKDFCFIRWSRKKLHTEFRDRAGQAVAPISKPITPPLPPEQSPPTLPPLLPA